MRATIMYAAGDVRVEDVPDATIVEPTDAIVRVTRACVCGSDLWPYASMERSDPDSPWATRRSASSRTSGRRSPTVKNGDLVVMPFAFSDGTCAFCHEGLPTACVHVGFFGNNGMNGAQAEALRIPFADGTLYPLPVGEDDALMPSLLTLSDVMATGHHAAVVAEVAPGRRAAVVGRRRRRPVRRHRRQAPRAPSRSSSWAATTTASRWHASSAPPTSSPSAARRRSSASASSPAARASTRCSSASARRVDGDGDRHRASRRPHRPRRRPAGRDDAAVAARLLRQHHIGGGPAPVRAYLDELLPDVLEGRIDPGRVFDRTVGLDGVPDGYRAMAEREAIKVMVRP